MTPEERLRAGEITTQEFLRLKQAEREGRAAPATPTPSAAPAPAPDDRKFNRPMLTEAQQAFSAKLEDVTADLREKSAEADAQAAAALGEDPRAAAKAAVESASARFPSGPEKPPESLFGAAYEALTPQTAGAQRLPPVRTDQGAFQAAKDISANRLTQVKDEVTSLPGRYLRGMVDVATPFQYGDQGLQLDPVLRGSDDHTVSPLDAVGELFQTGINVAAPPLYTPEGGVVAGAKRLAAGEGLGTLVPLESQAGALMRVAGGAAEAALVTGQRRAYEMVGLVDKRPDAWGARLYQPWSVGDVAGADYLADALQMVKNNEGATELGVASADKLGLKGVARDLWVGAHTIESIALPFEKVIGKGWAATKAPLQAAELSRATGVGYWNSLGAVVSEQLPASLTKSKLVDIGEAVEAGVLKDPSKIPDALRQDMEDILARAPVEEGLGLEGEDGMAAVLLDEQAKRTPGRQRDYGPGDARERPAEGADLTGEWSRRTIDDLSLEERASLAREAAKRRARSMLGDDQVVTVDGVDGDVLLVTRKEHAAALDRVRARAREVGLDPRQMVEQGVTAEQAARLEGELADVPGWRGGELPTGKFDQIHADAVNAIVGRWLTDEAGSAAGRRHGIRQYAPIATWLSKQAPALEPLLIDLPNYVSSSLRQVAPNPAIAHVPTAFRNEMMSHLRRAEGIAKDVYDDYFRRLDESKRSGEASSVEVLSDMLPEDLFIDFEALDKAQGDAASMRSAADAEKAALAEAQKAERKQFSADTEAKLEQEKKDRARLKRQAERESPVGEHRQAVAEANRAESNLNRKQNVDMPRAEAEIEGAQRNLQAEKERVARMLAEEQADAVGQHKDPQIAKSRDAIRRVGARLKTLEENLNAIIDATVGAIDPGRAGRLKTRILAQRQHGGRMLTEDGHQVVDPRIVVTKRPDGTEAISWRSHDDLIADRKAIVRDALKSLGKRPKGDATVAQLKAAFTPWATAATTFAKHQAVLNEVYFTKVRELGVVGKHQARGPQPAPPDPNPVGGIPGANARQAEALAETRQQVIDKPKPGEPTTGQGDIPAVVVDPNAPKVVEHADVKAAQREVDRATKRLEAVKADVEKYRQQLEDARGRQAAAKAKMEAQARAAGVQAANAAADQTIGVGEFDVDKATRAASVAASMSPEVAEALARARSVEAARETMLDRQAAERDAMAAKHEQALIDAGVLEEVATETRARLARAAQKIERSFTGPAYRQSPEERLSPEEQRQLVEAFQKVPEDEGKALKSVLRGRYAEASLANLQEGIFRLLVEGRIEAWKRDLAKWMVTSGFAIQSKGIDPLFLRAIERQLAGGGNTVVKFGDGRFVAEIPDVHDQAAAAFLTTWGITPSVRWDKRMEGGDMEGAVLPKLVADEVDRAARRGLVRSWQVTEAGVSGRGAEVAQRALSMGMTAWKQFHVTGLLGLRAPAFVMSNIASMPFFAAATVGPGAMLTSFGQYARRPAFMAALMTGWQVNGKIGDAGHAGKYLVAKDGRVYSASALAAAADQFGIDSSAPHVEYARDLVDDIIASAEKEAEGLGWRVASGTGRAYRRWNELVWEGVRAVDQTARMSVFVDQIERGVSVDQAARAARDSQLDYGALSPSERFILRKVIPFYAFTKKSMEAYAKNPAALGQQSRWIREFNKWMWEDEQDESLEGRLALWEQALPAGAQLRFLTGEMPPFMLLKLLGDLASAARVIGPRDPGTNSMFGPRDEAMGRLAGNFGPLASVAEYGFGVNAFTGNPMEPGAKTRDAQAASWVAENAMLRWALTPLVGGFYPKVNNDPAKGPVGATFWYAKNVDTYRAFMSLTGLGASGDALHRWTAIPTASPEERMYGGGSLLGLALKPNIEEPGFVQQAELRSDLAHRVEDQLDVEGRAAKQ